MVTFGNNGQGKIIGIDKIQITPSAFIDSVLLVKGLKHNLISISQLCDKGLKVSFEISMSIITNLKIIASYLSAIDMKIFILLI